MPNPTSAHRPLQELLRSGGRLSANGEKAPAAICRKVAEIENGGIVSVWATAIHHYTCVDDMVEGIYRLIQSDLEGAVNIGCPEYVSADELVVTVAEVAGKKIHKKYVDGPVVVQSRNFSNERIYSLRWEAKVFLKEGIGHTYPWIEEQMKATQEARRKARSRNDWVGRCSPKKRRSD